MARLVINTRLFTTLKSVSMLKIIELFFDLCIPHFVVECALKSFITCSLEDGFVHVCNFQNRDEYRTLQNVSIYFLLFYHKNVILKTDIMLDYW